MDCYFLYFRNLRNLNIKIIIKNLSKYIDKPMKIGYNRRSVVKEKARRWNVMSICPKNKSSKSRRDKRRANWKMSAPNLVKCSKCGALMMSHRVCKACGSYNKKEILAEAAE